MFNTTVKRTAFNLLVAACFVYHLTLLTVNLTYQVAQCLTQLIPVVQRVVHPSKLSHICVPLATITHSVVSDCAIKYLPTGDQPITLSTAQLDDHALRFVDPAPEAIVIPLYPALRSLEKSLTGID
jgi:hypothetical protein